MVNVSLEPSGCDDAMMAASLRSLCAPLGRIQCYHRGRWSYGRSHHRGRRKRSVGSRLSTLDSRRVIRFAVDHMSVARQSLEYAHKSTQGTVHRHVGFLTGPNGWLLFQRQFRRDANGRLIWYHPELIRSAGMAMLSWYHIEVQTCERQSMFKSSHSFTSLARQGRPRSDDRQEEPSRLPI